MPRLRRSLPLTFCASLLLTTSCLKAERSSPPPPEASSPGAGVGATSAVVATPTPLARTLAMPTPGPDVSRAERRVVRTATLSLEADSIDDAQRAANRVAAEAGGFVASSELRVHGLDERASSTLVVVRVPSEHFASALDALRALGRRVVHEKITGQDVTEEFVDLDARLRSHRALEGRFLEIMKEARTVKDALDVQQKLGEVRDEIERIEGRRRFLDDRTSLSTIEVTIAPRAPVAAASDLAFAEALRGAARDAVAVSGAIVTGGIRLVGVTLPIAIFCLLPVHLMWRWVSARRRRSAPQVLAV